MSDIALEGPNHFILVLGRILFHVIGERQKIGVALIGNFLSFYKIEDMVVALKLFLTSGNGGLNSLLIFLIGFVIDSSKTQVGFRILFLERYLEAYTIGLDKLEPVGPEGEKEVLKASGEVMSRVLVDSCRIEVDQKVLESELLHALHGHIGILMVEILVEIEDETIVIEPGTVVVDEVRKEGSDPVYPCRIPLFLLWIENGLVEGIEKNSGILFKHEGLRLIEPEFRKIDSSHFTEYLLEFSNGGIGDKVAHEKFFQYGVLYALHGFVIYLFLIRNIEGRKDIEIVRMRREYTFLLTECPAFKLVESSGPEIVPSMWNG